jgi:repressor LexA
MKELTARQQQILRFIQSKQDSEGLAPTFREIAGHFRFRSPNAALAHVQALLAKGVLKRLPGRARSLQITGSDGRRAGFQPVSNSLRSGNQRQAGHRRAGALWRAAESLSYNKVVSVPIYGAIPAGLPQDTAQEEEGCVLIDVETLGIKPTARMFGLKVRGDSMLGRHIVDGDVAIIEHGVQPRTGDVVAALIDGQVTLKTFILQRSKPYLRAENPRYPDLIPQEELQIQGVMVALVRRRK